MPLLHDRHGIFSLMQLSELDSDTQDVQQIPKHDLL